MTAEGSSVVNLPFILQPSNSESPRWLELSFGHSVLDNRPNSIPGSLENGGTRVISEYSFPCFLCVCFKICIAAKFLK